VEVGNEKPDMAEWDITGVSLLWVVVISTPYQMAPVVYLKLHE
jgi:hypothetical protein